MGLQKSNTTEETPINMRKSNYSNIWTDSKKLNVLNKNKMIMKVKVRIKVK